MDTDLEMHAIINGQTYPVTVTHIDKVRWYARVTVQNAQPFARPTHGGWAYYSDGLVTISNLRDASGNVIPIERRRIEISELFHTQSIRQTESV